MVMIMIVMPAQGWIERSIAELAQMVRQGKVTARTLVGEGLQEGRGEDHPRPLAGVPLVAKDNINAAIAASTDVIWLELTAEYSRDDSADRLRLGTSGQGIGEYG